MNFIYAHLFGDYILQNDWMATGKKKSSWVCLVHVLFYLLPFCFTTLAWWKIWMIGVEHFIQDRTTFVTWFMRVRGSESFIQPPYGPWSVIVTDNILHILFMALIVWL